VRQCEGVAEDAQLQVRLEQTVTLCAKPCQAAFLRQLVTCSDLGQWCRFQGQRTPPASLCCRNCRNCRNVQDERARFRCGVADVAAFATCSSGTIWTSEVRSAGEPVRKSCAEVFLWRGLPVCSWDGPE
jgi:hypothetical protein